MLLTDTTSSPRRWLWLFMAIGLAVVVFFRNLNDAPVADDHAFFENAKQCWEYGHCTVFSGQFFRPFGSWFWWASVALGGENVAFHHLLNFVLHGLCTWLLAEIVLGLTNSKISAAVAAGLFLIHPIHAEAVIWLSSRFDLLATAALLGYLLIWVKSPQKLSVPNHLLLPILAFTAIFSKESGYIVMPLSLVLALCAKREGGWTAVALTFGTSLVLLGYRFFSIGTFSGGYENDSSVVEWISQAYGISAFEWLLAPINETAGMSSYLMILLRVGMLAPLPFIAWGIWATRKKRIYIPALVLILIPPALSGIGYAAGVGLQHGRYHYLPSAGYLIVFGIGFAALMKNAVGNRKPSPVIGGAILVAFLAFGVGHISQSRIWANAAAFHFSLIEQVKSDLETRLILDGKTESTLVLINGPQNAKGAYVFKVADAVIRHYPHGSLRGIEILHEIQTEQEFALLRQPSTYIYLFDWERLKYIYFDNSPRER